MTLGELEKALEDRDLRGLSLSCWDAKGPTWTAVCQGEVVAGSSLPEAIDKLLDRFPVLSEGARS